MASGQEKVDEGLDDLRKQVIANLNGYELNVPEIGEDSYELGKSLACIHDCTKNPRHESFIPIDDFTIQSLPEGYRDQMWLDFINCTAELTGCIGVSHVSKGRPDTWPDKDTPYPLADARGSNFHQSGTGRVCRVSNKFYTADDGVSCPCGKCKESDTPSFSWGKFDVLTANHVVFDDFEARKSQLKLYYRSPQSQVKVAYGVRVRNGYIAEDWCDVKYVTHDPHLHKQLQDTWRLWNDLDNKSYTISEDCKNADPLVIVSHPHGCCQYVTLGRYSHTQLEVGRPEYFYSLLYKTDTCPGSSGAPLINPGVGSGWPVVCHPHSRGGKEFNQSAVY